MRATWLVVVVVLLLGGRAGAGPRRSELSPEAAVHNDRGVDLLAAGDAAAAVPELLAAYAAMPDPLRWRAGRGKVLGSLRSALDQLYGTTGDPAYLCTLQRLLREHIEALLLALGDEAESDAVAGSLARLREVDGRLAGHRCDGAPGPESAPVGTRAAPLEPPPARPVGPRPPPSLRPTPSPEAPRDPGRSLRRVSGALFGAGFVGITGAALGTIFYADRRAHLQALSASAADHGGGPTAAERHDAAEILNEGQRIRMAAIASGVIGCAAVVAGAVLRARALRRGRAAPVELGGVGALQIHF